MSSAPPYAVDLKLKHVMGSMQLGVSPDIGVIPSEQGGSSSDGFGHPRYGHHVGHAPAHLHNPPPPPTTNSMQNMDSSHMPWTLGSTDGSYAALALMQAAAASPPSGSGADIGLVDPGSNAAPSSQAGGAAIGSAGEATATNNLNALAALNSQRSLYQDRIFQQPSSAVEASLTAGCEVMGFDIAEMWLRTGPKTHQLTNSHLRPTALEDSLRKELVDVYYGEKSSERTHRLSPALCKRAKEANDVVWVTAHTPHESEALRCSISNVRTAVAIPVCHQASNTNFTVIFFSIRRIIMRPTAVEFLVHIALASAVASINSLAEEGLIDREPTPDTKQASEGGVPPMTQSEHLPLRHNMNRTKVTNRQRVEPSAVAGLHLDLQWRQLHNVEYLTDGGNSWIHTAVFNGKPVVVKTLKPECQDVAMAINEIEGELAVHSRLIHPNIVGLLGAGTTSKGVRFVVLERLDGGTLTQTLGYDTRIRDRRRRFWKKKTIAFQDVLRYGRSIADAMSYCHEEAIPGSMILHRDLKPDNIGFSLTGEVKILDFGLATIVENASPASNEVYTMSGETGSLRYMAPEVADALPYNHKADVYSFGIILWELNSGKKPFEGLNREMFYERVVHDGERPQMNKKWPEDFVKLLTDCWNMDMGKRPNFSEVVERIDSMLESEKGGASSSKKTKMNFRRISGIIDRHSTWF